MNMHETPAPAGQAEPPVPRIQRYLGSPLVQRLIWVLFAVFFYYAGLAFTTWLLQPDAFQGGYQWILVVVFPLLVPAFFIVNRRLGCASGHCAGGQCELTPEAQHK